MFVQFGYDNWVGGKIVSIGSMQGDFHNLAMRIVDLCRNLCDTTDSLLKKGKFLGRVL